jgi:hypothetical protein
MLKVHCNIQTSIFLLISVNVADMLAALTQALNNVGQPNAGK